MKRSGYSDEQLKFIIEKKNAGFTWEQVTDQYNYEFNDQKTANAIRKTYDRFQDYEFSSEEMLTNIRKAFNATKNKSIVAKENKTLLEYIEGRQSLVDELQDLVKSVKFTKPKIIKTRRSKSKKCMTMEVMLTDLHYGKLTKQFNGEKAREYASKMGDVVVGEIERHSKNYNIDEVVVFLGGDIIENSDFHGMESRMASEFGNSEQVRIATHSLYEDFFVKLASTGVKSTVVCITGNHDRVGHNKTYQSPGKENLTWIIYQLLDLLCQNAKMGFEFIIPEGISHVHRIYNNNILYEHGDFIKGGMTRTACEGHMAKRSNQLGQLIDYMRLGHYHEPTMYGRGRIIINGSFPGQDGYSEINGYNSESVQIINYYIKSEKRPTSFYHSFPVYLEEVE